MSGIPQNTSYSPTKSFSNLAKFNPKGPILTSSSSGSAPRKTPAALKSYRLTPTKEDAVSATATPVQPYDVVGNQPVNGNLPALPTPAAPAPGSYPSWKNPEQVPISAKFTNLSAQLGGGQFAPTPSGATNESVKSIEIGNDVTRASYIPGVAGIGSGAMQIDHIVPVFLGGTDTDDNKQILSIRDHLQKTKTQEVVRALYQHKIIGKNEALNYAINWKNLPGADQVDLTPVDSASKQNKLLASEGKPTKPIPTINVDTAKKIFNEWRNPSMDLGFMGSLKGIKENWGDAVKKVQTAVNNTAVKFVPPATWDFVKGITEGYTGGWIQPGETPEEAYGTGTIGKIDKGIGKAAKFAGNMVGSIAAWMTLERYLQKGLTAVAGKFGGNILGKAAGATEKYIFSPAVKTATAAEKALAESAAEATAAGTITQGGAGATKMVKNGLAKMLASRDLGKLITRNVVVSDIFGQLSKPIEGESRLHRLMSDSVNGLIFGATPPGLKNAYIPAVLGAASTYIASGDPAAALKTGLMFGGMHALGAVSGPAAEDAIVNDARRIAHENAAEHIKSITGRDLPGMPGPKASQKSINAYKAMIDNEISNAIDIGTETGKINLTNSANEVKRLKVVGQILKGEVDMQSVGWREFGKNADKDWAAFNIKETGATGDLPVSERQNLSPEAVSFFNENPDLISKTAEPIKVPAIGTTEAKQSGIDETQARNFTHVQLTGITDAAEAGRENNIRDFIDLVKDGKLSQEIYVSRDKSMAPYIEAINKKAKPADVKAGRAQTYDPNNVIVAFYQHPDSNELRIVGLWPTKSRIGEVVVGPDGKAVSSGMPNSQNENIMKRGQTDYLDHTAHNDALAAEMDKNKVRTMKIGVDDFYEGSKGANIGMVSDKPYLHVSTSDSLWREAKYRNRNISNAEAKTTQGAIRSWQEQIKKGETPVEMKSPEEINKEFDRLVKSKKLNIPKNIISEFSIEDKTKIIRDYYARNTPKLAQTIANVSPNKPIEKAAEAIPEAPKKLPKGPGTPKVTEQPAPEVKIAAEKPQTAEEALFGEVNGVKMLTNEKPATPPPDFLNPDIETPPKVPAAATETTGPEAGAPAAKVEAAGQKAGKAKPKDFSQYDSETGVNRGISNLLKEKYQETYKTDKKAAMKIRQESKSFSREGLRAQAQNAFKEAGSKDYVDGFNKFYKNVTDNVKSITGKEVNLSADETAVLHRQYNRLLQGHTRQAVYISTKNNVIKIAPSDADLMGEADRAIIEFNKKHDLPKDAMEVIGIDKDSEFSKEYSKMSSAERIYRINDDLKKVPGKDGKVTEFIPVGKTAKGEKSIIAVKYEPSLVKMYDQAKHGGEKLSDQDKFSRVFAQDILGLPKETTADDFVKRSPLIFQRYEKYMGSKPNEEISVRILKSKTVKEAGGVDVTAFADPKSSDSQQAIKIYGDAKEFDGKLVLGEDIFDHIVESFNYNAGKKDMKALKPILQGLVKVGDEAGNIQYMIQKGHIIKADPAYRAHLKDVYGVEFGKNEGISFAENVKIGPEEGTVKIPLKNFFMRSLSYENESGIGPSFYSKFNASDNVTPDIIRIDKENVKNLNELTESLSEAKNKIDADKAFTAFEEKTGVDVSDFTYGAREKIYDNGAGRKRLAHDLKKVLKNLFFDTIYKPKVEDSKILFLTPSIKLQLDGPGKPDRYLNSDEVAVGKKYAKQAKIKDGDAVIVKREPANHISDYIYAKARIGDNMGATSLGDEHIMLSSHNTYVKVKGDHDGDGVAIFKVGEKNMPESFAKAIESRGKNVIPIREATKRTKLEFTNDNILKVMSSQLVGDDQTGSIASMGRVVNLLKDNDAVIKIEGASSGTKSKYQIIVKGKVVDSGETTRLKDTIYTKLDWGESEDQLKQQISQYALDSKGSDDIIRKTSTADHPDGGDLLFMLKNAFTVKDANGGLLNKDKSSLNDRTAKSIKGALKAYQQIFDVSQSDNISELMYISGHQYGKDVTSVIKKATETAQKIKDAGGTLHPTQERLLIFKDIKDISFKNEDFLLADVHGQREVVEKLSSKIKEMSPAAKEIVKKAKEARQKYNDSSLYSKKDDTPEIKARKKTTKASLKQEVVDMYGKYFDEDKLSESDVEAIAYWAATSPDGDITWGQYGPRKYVNRYDEFIGNSPEVSNVYYGAYENAPLAENIKPADAGMSAAELAGIALAGTEIAGRRAPSVTRVVTGQKAGENLPPKPKINYKNLGG